ncbi:Pleckstrin homology domain-containing family A member 8 [Habropoda laboriosa]|uniref:Pleckstrin homology domain-containing family A member 8 n=2 Tax=Habropoda laboriosa TaxID=597456 RepID=A0A0L7R702_9HYME|nr:Pleckstrin homology domain-containing family A member 8 [Habropoda laboriosa]
MLSPSSSNDDNKDILLSEIEVLFPNVIQDEIETAEFLTAARGIVRILDKFGKVFAAVKHDIEGNIDKLYTKYATDKEDNATLQDIILTENQTETDFIATESLMWLTRDLHMILLFFEKIVQDAKTGTPTEDLAAFLQMSYKETLEPYDGWMAQLLFNLLSRLAPTRSQLLQALAVKRTDDSVTIINRLEIYSIRLRTNVSAIQSFYKIYNLLQ